MSRSQATTHEWLLLALLDGASFATALRPKGRPGRIFLPEQPDQREVLVRSHLSGGGMELTFGAEGCEPWREYVDPVVLAAYCPAQDGRCRWLGVDLDASDHGVSGLADPAHAVRVIAERASNAGLLDGLLVARSRRGNGRHIFLMLPEPILLGDAVVGLAGLIAAAFRVAASDVADCDSPHAFRQASGGIAKPGQAGALELVPHSTQKPKYGWSLTLPAAGAFAKHGGGVIVDPFPDKPTSVEATPSCNPGAWSCLVTESRWAIASSARPKVKVHPRTPTSALDRIHERTRSFLDGQCTEGHRNRSAFAASSNLLGCGINEGHAWQLVLKGSKACGLPEREAKAAFSSAVKSNLRRRH